MITINQKGDFKKVTRYFEKIKNGPNTLILRKYGEYGVSLLKENTPVDSGRTANSWTYSIDRTRNRAIISFYNMNEVRGVNIAIILEYGHGTRNGGWVYGRNYISPAIQSAFDKMVQDVWKEVTSV